ncbi:MAG: PDZ domain-containing protein, partial [Planctomycetota bacterium]|nr:PDZ domain-containing protein [Planctomycetota bacterium]
MKKWTPLVALPLAVPVLIIACAASSASTSEEVSPAILVLEGPALPLAASGIDIADTRLLAQPACSDEHVAFVYAGDLWVAGLDASGVRRLTTHAGSESQARFSPDGDLIAFSGQYDGNTDVYVVPTAGGVPRRLTWHPGSDVVQDFTPDGSAVLFTSGRAVHSGTHRQLFTVPVEGGHPTQLPIPTAFKAAYSPDGSKIAYTPLFEAFSQWKNYRGGTATRIWIYDVADHSVLQIFQPAGRCNDTDPMWIGETLYFRSDRNGEFNLFSFDPATESITQLTTHADFPIVNASAGGGRLVYEQAGWLHTFAPGEGARRLEIGVAADLIETRPRYVDGSQYIRSAGISPTGKRAVFGYRGEIITLPAEKGDPRNLTRTLGVHEREPAWSPDGRWIAYFSDASGEYELHVAPQDGRGEVRSFTLGTLGGAGFYESPDWSPDGEKISFTDNSWSLHVLDVESGAVTKVAQEPLYGPFKTLHHAWSPDSKWIAYTLNTMTSLRRLHLYDVENDASHEVTDGLSDVSEPVFDEGGKYLYLAASTDAGPAKTWFAMSNADVDVTNSLYLVVLSKETASPLAKESDEEEPEEDEKEADEEDADDETAESEENGEDEDEGDEEEDEPVVIDLDGIGQRIVALPLPAAFYRNLVPGGEGKLLYVKQDGTGAFTFGGSGDLASFDLESREETVLKEDVAGFTLSADKKKILLTGNDAWWIADADGKIDGSKGGLSVDRLQVRIDPHEEWTQIFDEAWRINRDYFYDPGYHGADWPAMRGKYAQFLPHLTIRSDLNRVIRWMCSELAVGHHRVGGGDTLVQADTIPGGLLGADFDVTDGRYRFAKIFGGLNWTPELRAPLTEPGVDVTAGEYLLAVEGRDLRPPENLYSRFENTAGKIVEITVGPNPDGADSRTVQVVPVENEGALRNRDWVEGNIAKVTAATDGRVAYVYVPNTAGLGHVYFKRYFFPQADREAIIIDERHNGGGQVADYYIDILRRPYISHWAMRYGNDQVTPQGAILGPRVMLIDETAGSGGDLLPWMFRKLGLGPLVGKRTWGGLVGTLGFPV